MELPSKQKLFLQLAPQYQDHIFLRYYWMENNPYSNTNLQRQAARGPQQIAGPFHLTPKTMKKPQTMYVSKRGGREVLHTMPQIMTNIGGGEWLFMMAE